MKKLVLLALSLLLAFPALAKKDKNVGYCYRDMKADGMCCEFSVVKDSSIYLVVSVSSLYNAIVGTAKLQVKFFNDDTLTLYSDDVTSGNRHYYLGMGVSVDYKTGIIKFEVTKEQIEKFSLGVKKLRLNSVPNMHEMEFKKDKIGNKIYKSYLSAKAPSDF